MTSTPRETNELRAVRIEVADQVLTTNVELCVTRRGVRPTEDTWEPAVMRDGKTCVRIAHLTPGYYDVWGRGSLGDEVGVVGPFALPIS